MIYRAIGTRSDSSMSGLEIAFVEFQAQGGKWTFEVLNIDIYTFSADWITRLEGANQLTALDYLQLHADFGQHIAMLVNKFIEQHQLNFKAAVIGSHGHTILGISEKVTYQIGDGATIAAITGLPVVSDFFSVDVALGGRERIWNLLQQKLSADAEFINKSVLCAFMGVLRWREEYNVFASETGAYRNSIGGALWMGQDA